jgi:serine/threonine protein kinase
MHVSPISRYKVICPISDEHTTEIYKAVDTRTNETVVIKFRKRGCRQAANEINILPNLHHRNILPLRDVISTRFG